MVWLNKKSASNKIKIPGNMEFYYYLDINDILFYRSNNVLKDIVKHPNISKLLGPDFTELENVILNRINEEINDISSNVANVAEEEINNISIGGVKLYPEGLKEQIYKMKDDIIYKLKESLEIEYNMDVSNI